MDRLRRILHAALSLGAVCVGISVMVLLVKTKPVPPVRSTMARVPTVAVSVVEPQTRQIPVVGYGTVRPKNQIQIVPQISGKLIYSHKDLAQGKVVPSGELIFEIDPTVYQARVLQAEAEISGLEAALNRHDQEMKNLGDRVANADQMLTIDRKDYETSERLFEVDQVGTQRQVDLVFRKYLRQKDVVVELKNRRAMVPHIKLETQAKLEAARSRLKQSEHDLDNTKIFCPFKARVEAINAYTSQVVTAHFSIATLTDMEAFELSIGIDPRNLRWLAKSIRPTTLESIDPAAQSEVKVVWSLPAQEFSWRGHVSRFERVDEETRTARFIVEVRDVDMAATVVFGSSDAVPDLSIGMFCRAELPAEPLVDALFVPRHAIYEGRWVYVFQPDGDSTTGNTGRIVRREIAALRTVGDEILVDFKGRDDTQVCDLKAGEMLIVSQLAKPVVGMRVSLRETKVARLPDTIPVVPAAEDDHPRTRVSSLTLGQIPAGHRLAATKR